MKIRFNLLAFLAVLDYIEGLPRVSSNTCLDSCLGLVEMFAQKK